EFGERAGEWGMYDYSAGAASSVSASAAASFAFLADWPGPGDGRLVFGLIGAADAFAAAASSANASILSPFRNRAKRSNVPVRVKILAPASLGCAPTLSQYSRRASSPVSVGGSVRGL